jgi:geranylgeranyl pyrophosphate synthase
LDKQGLPTAGELSGLLGFAEEPVSDLVRDALLSPLGEFLSRPGKQFRGQLVKLSFQLAGGPPVAPADAEAWCRLGAEVLEHIHAGSLVVDDIQDGSAERRGKPTLHREHGIPLALNAGNWLYFWPLERVRTWGLPPDRELRVYQVCHEALLKAHFGQALDVGVPIDTLDRARIPEVSLASLELKTGALMAMATRLGAVLGGAGAARVEALGEFGKRFGIALQMLDDLGNFTGKQGKPDPKRWEDLKLRRPSWIWASVARHGTDEDFACFARAASALPDEKALVEWAAGHSLIEDARAEAEQYLESALADLERSVGSAPAVTEIQELGRRLAKAYR